MANKELYTKSMRSVASGDTAVFWPRTTSQRHCAKWDSIAALVVKLLHSTPSTSITLPKQWIIRGVAGAAVHVDWWQWPFNSAAYNYRRLANSASFVARRSRHLNRQYILGMPASVASTELRKTITCHAGQRSHSSHIVSITAIDSHVLLTLLTEI